MTIGGRATGCCAVLGAAILSLSQAAGPALAARATTPRATARAVLLRCYSKAAALDFASVAPQSGAQINYMHAAYLRCTDNASALKLIRLEERYPHVVAFHDAYRAYFTLGLGLGDYLTYFISEASGQPNGAALSRGDRELDQGKVLARRALQELR